MSETGDHRLAAAEFLEGMLAMQSDPTIADALRAPDPEAVTRNLEHFEYARGLAMAPQIKAGDSVEAPKQLVYQRAFPYVSAEGKGACKVVLIYNRAATHNAMVGQASLYIEGSEDSDGETQSQSGLLFSLNEKGVLTGPVSDPEQIESLLFSFEAP